MIAQRKNRSFRMKFLISMALLLSCYVVQAQQKLQQKMLIPIDDGGGGPVSVSFSGPTTVNVNDYDYYYVSVSGGVHTSTSYSVNGGTIVSQSKTNVRVRWTSSGFRSVTAKPIVSGTLYNKGLIIRVYPATPGVPSVSNNACGNKTISRGSPPGGVTWYWQTSSSGTSTGNSSTNYVVTSSRTIYLRARDNASGLWSANSRAVAVTVNPKPSTPPKPTITRNCGNTKLTRSNPPSGHTYYWQSGSGGTSTSNSSSTVTLTSNTTYYLRSRNNLTGCWSSARSVSVSVYSNLSAGSINGAKTICYNSSAGTLGNSSSASGCNNSFTYQWQVSSNNSSWSNISGATGTTYAPGNLTSTKYYRRRVKSLTATKYTSSVKITVKSNLSAGSINGAKTICYNATAGTLGSASDASGGYGTLNYQWQVSSNNSSWSNISGATATTYAPGNLTSTKYYRRRVKSANCSGYKYTGSVKVTVQSNLSAGSINGAKTICYNTSAGTLGSASDASGGYGTLTYQWQVSSNNSSWSNISGATATTYAPGNLTTTKYYRRRVKATNCSGYKYTGSVKVTVQPNLSAGSINGAKTICYNTSAGTLGSASDASGGYGTLTYQWQVSGNNSSWSNISGATATTYAPGNLTSTKYYRRRVKATNCSGYQYTGSVKVTVQSNLSAGSINGAKTICHNTSAGTLGSASDASGGYGTLAYQWQVSSNNSSWSNIAGATATTYAPGNLTATTFYRRRVKSTNCNDYKYTGSIKITVNSDLSPGSINGTKTICYNASAGTLGSATDASGGFGTLNYQWQESNNNSSWSNISGATATTYAPGNLTATKYYRRRVKSANCNDEKYTSSVKVTVRNNLSAGSISGNQTTCQSESTSTITSTTAASGGNSSYSYQWQSSPDGNTGWANINGATAITYSPGELSSTTYFRRRVQSCGQTTYTNIIVKTVNDLPAMPANPSLNVECGQTDIISSPAPTGTSWYWQGMNANGTATTNSSATYSVNDSGTYYLRAQNDATGCWSASRSIVVSIDEIPEVPAIPSITKSCGETTLTRLAPPSGITWYWQGTDADGYDDELSGAIYSTTTSGTYYLRAKDNTNGCWSDSRSVAVTVDQIPSLPSATVTQLCGYSRVNKGAFPFGETWYWQISAEGMDTSNSADHVTVNVAGTVYLRSRSNEGCWGPTRSISVSIKDVPALPVIQEVSYTYDGTVITRANPPANETWYWQTIAIGEDETNDEPTFIAPTAGNYYLRSKLDNGCWSESNVTTLESQEPVNVTATSISNESLLVSWEASASNETGFRISRSSSVDPEYQEIYVAGPAETEYTDSGLSTATTYHYRVQAIVGAELSSGVQVATAATSAEFNGDESVNHEPVYNGNISGMRWKNAFEESEQLFTYTYDGLNRLSGAQYAAKAGSIYEKDKGYFSVPQITYDMNGNIKSLIRQGINASGNADIIDELTYHYTGGGNQLTSVNDQRGNSGFKDGNSSDDDYAYDANGNMIVDKNKGIDSIKYNHLNLPANVYITNAEGSGRIEYIYDAAGVKLAQVVYQDGVETKRTDYVGGFIYESSEGQARKLSFIQHEEGRLVPNESDGTYDYQYHLKDHLGNVRLTFMEEGDSETSMATFEDEEVATEADYFDNYDKMTRIKANLFDHTDSGTAKDFSIRLNGSDNEKIGIAKQLKVKPGDVIDIEVFAKYYDQSESGSWVGILNTLASEIMAGAPGVVPDGFSSGPNGIPFADFLSGKEDPSDYPKAYLNYFVFDSNFQPIAGLSGYQQISDAGKEDGSDVAHEQLSHQLEIKEAGYVYIYLSNENDELIDVFFDDFTVTQHHTPIVQKDDYYPFGLSFNEYQKAGNVEQRFKYNGKELQDQTNWYDYGARMYAPDLIRFMTLDPKSDVYHSQSPFVYAANDPISLVDRNGEGPGVTPLTSRGLRKLANTHNIHGNKRIGEFFERAAIKGISSSYMVMRNSKNFESPVRRARNIVRGGKPSAVRPDMIGLTKKVDGVNVYGDKNSFYEAKATKSTLTRGYRKGQIEGMIDVISNNKKNSKTKKGVLTLVTTSDTGVSDKLLEYATQRGVSVYQITAGVNGDGNIVFSDPKRLNDLPENFSLLEDILNLLDMDDYDTFTPVNPSDVADDDLTSDPTDPDPAELDN